VQFLCGRFQECSDFRCFVDIVRFLKDQAASRKRDMCLPQEKPSRPKSNIPLVGRHFRIIVMLALTAFFGTGYSAIRVAFCGLQAHSLSSAEGSSLANALRNGWGSYLGAALIK
jgi:hypothetical protein